VCQASIGLYTDEGLFTDTAVHERGKNDREIKTGARELTKVGANQTMEERMVQREKV